MTDIPNEEQVNPADKIQVTCDMYDNRDETETWLRIPGVGIVIVDPVDLYENAHENNPAEVPVIGDLTELEQQFIWDRMFIEHEQGLTVYEQSDIDTMQRVMDKLQPTNLG